MKDGRLVQPHPSLQEIRDRFTAAFAAFDPKYKTLTAEPTYPVNITPQLSQLQVGT